MPNYKVDENYWFSKWIKKLKLSIDESVNLHVYFMRPPKEPMNVIGCFFQWKYQMPTQIFNQNDS